MQKGTSAKSVISKNDESDGYSGIEEVVPASELNPKMFEGVPESWH